MTFDEIVARVRTQGGFDTSTSNIAVSDVQGWVQERYKQAVAQARWRKAEVSLGAAVSGQAAYLLPSSVVEVRGLRVGSLPYDQAGTEQVWDLVNGTATLDPRGRGGVFAQEFLSDGTVEIVLYPTPSDEQAGQDVTALCAVFPDPLVSGQSPAVPDDFHEALVWGAIATGLATIEERLDSANYFEGLFGNAVERLKGRANSRLNGGPSQILVKGYHF